MFFTVYLFGITKNINNILWNNKEKNPSSISRPSKHKNVRNIHEIPRSVKWKIEKNYASKKNNHIRQYLRDLSIFLRLRSCSDFTIHREKNKRCNITIFSFKTTHQTLISKNNSFLSDLDLSTQASAPWTKPQKKIPLKTIALLYWVGS